MVGHATPLCKASRSLIVTLLVITVLTLPWPLWMSVYGFIDASFLEIFVLPYNSTYNMDDRAMGGTFGTVSILYFCFLIVKTAMFSLDLDRRLSQHSRKKWLNYYLVIEAVFFLLMIPFGVVYVLYYSRTHNGTESNTILYALLGITLGLQVICYPMAMRLRNVENKQMHNKLTQSEV